MRVNVFETTATSELDRLRLMVTVAEEALLRIANPSTMMSEDADGYVVPSFEAPARIALAALRLMREED